MERIINIQPLMNGLGVYGKETVFRVESVKKIKMMFLMITLTPSGLTTFPAPTSPFVVGNTLMESNGLPICRVTGNYTLGRVEKQDLTLYNAMIGGMTLKTSFNTKQTVVYPLFFWVYDGQLFDTDIYGGITIRNFTRNTKEEMGMSLDLSSIEISLRVHYVLDDIPKELDFTKAYNCFQYYKTGIDNVIIGTNTHIEILELQRKVRSLTFMMRRQNNASIRNTIDKITLTYPNGIRNEISDSTNYFLQSTIGNNRSDTFYIQLDQAYLMNEQRAPVKAEIEYTSSSTDNCDLFISYEYDTEYEQYSNIGMKFLSEKDQFSI